MKLVYVTASRKLIQYLFSNTPSSFSLSCPQTRNSETTNTSRSSSLLIASSLFASNCFIPNLSYVSWRCDDSHLLMHYRHDTRAIRIHISMTSTHINTSRASRAIWSKTSVTSRNSRSCRPLINYPSFSSSQDPYDTSRLFFDPASVVTVFHKDMTIFDAKELWTHDWIQAKQVKKLQSRGQCRVTPSCPSHRIPWSPGPSSPR